MHTPKNKLTELIKNYDLKKINDGINSENYPENYLKLFGKDVLWEVKQNSNIVDDDIKELLLRTEVFEEISNRLRELMKIDNFSILTGAGSSISVGGVLFNFEQLEKGWVNQIFEKGSLKNDYSDILKKFKATINDKQHGVEDFITFLYKLENASILGYDLQEKSTSTKLDLKITEIKNSILEGLKKLCILPSTGKELKGHKTFIKRIISRPINLRRTNLFTTNYDLVFEKAMDELGIIYVDGFIGGLKKFFHPESFNYDYYYPATTTEGNISRMERVLHYYKIHGSLNWIDNDDDSTWNIYGIEKKENEQESENVLIYPTPMKEQDTIGFPYSEMFRKLSNTIQQPQSVLLCFGYSFGDYHINRIILEALSIPSFQLIIISYTWSDNIKKIYKQFKDEPSVGFIIGPEFADWETFATNLLPDLPTIDLEEKYQHKRNSSKSSLKTIKP